MSQCLRLPSPCHGRSLGCCSPPPGAAPPRCWPPATNLPQTTVLSPASPQTSGGKASPPKCDVSGDYILWTQNPLRSLPYHPPLGSLLLSLSWVPVTHFSIILCLLQPWATSARSDVGTFHQRLMDIAMARLALLTAQRYLRLQVSAEIALQKTALLVNLTSHMQKAVFSGL